MDLDAFEREARARLAQRARRPRRVELVDDFATVWWWVVPLSIVLTVLVLTILLTPPLPSAVAPDAIEWRDGGGWRHE